jgi:hypothetical protein
MSEQPRVELPLPRRLGMSVTGLPPPRRARGPGAPPLARLTRALLGGDGAGLVLPGRALLPDAAGHGGSRRRGAAHARRRRLDRQRWETSRARTPWRRWHPGSSPSSAPPTTARLPRPAPGRRQHRHIRGLTDGSCEPATLRNGSEQEMTGASNAA